MKRFTKFTFIAAVLMLGALGLQAQEEEKRDYKVGRNYKVVTEKNAEYPGGNEAMYMFFYKNMEFPAEARENKISGQINVSFDVETDSTVSNVEALNDLGYGTKAEAIRLVKLLKFAPAIQNGRATRQHMMVAVLF